jgi:ketosteroid isomerase-like protein
LGTVVPTCLTRRPSPAAIILVATCVAACGRDAAGRTATAGGSATDAALADTLVGEIAAAYDFSRPGVPERLLGLYPASGPVVSAASGAVTTSRDALRAEIDRFWTRVGQNMQGARFVVGERHATRLGDDAAVLTLTYTIPHRTPEGRPHTLGGAWTAIFRRTGPRWVIVQEHLSDTPRVVAGGATTPAAGDTAHGGHAGH